MKRRILGNTGLEVSVLGCGVGSLCGSLPELTESAAIKSVCLALDHGINLFDTAPSCKAAGGEHILGKGLHGIPRHQYFVATKVGRYGSAGECDFSTQRTLKGVEESLTRLGVDYLDIVQVQNVQRGQVPQMIRETLPALRKAQAEGKVRFIGITGARFDALLPVLAMVEVDLVQMWCHSSLYDGPPSVHLPALRETGIGILNSLALDVTLPFEDQAGPHPARGTLDQQYASAASYCRARGADLDTLALQFAVGEPSIHSTLIRIDSPSRMLETIRKATRPPRLELLTAVSEMLRPDIARAKARR